MNALFGTCPGLSLSESSLDPFAQSGQIGACFLHLPSVPSTNRVIADLGRRDYPTGTVVVADHQTEGRGKGERVWVSNPGDSLCLSILLRPRRPIAELAQATLVAAVGVREGLSYTGLDARIKWPNDLLVDGRKICGILCELVTTPEGDPDFLIVGIGLNVRTPPLPDDLPDRVTSVSAEVGADASRFALLSHVLSALDVWFGRWEDRGFDPIRRAWLSHSCTIGRRVSLDCGASTVTGIATDMGADGSLGIRDEGGVCHRFHFGETSFPAPQTRGAEGVSQL
ncbi:biotin--[acetyl-CoA-carboxylase] ligase [Roseospira marina]|uniref:Biotin--[acetyl-CoA-carboxylase] ligase n=1 Tax=Roseospira marina TaxID=140057 RepID=A0A5M6ID06_9PROT|nr:biotin--[acetyl-CoA-carboxylase] ligase [Roseospira marina]KAA5606136.1 biotin--[acetyl-CoA-carboxylase] ligase [Roseospira marina]MBB4314274.1 BirA family biotin operon repressor/biotin-[acetyl-CoA-carboxylase] ligase [Roseospira marina]MBB5087434.1 BirA family biotin operon repressor/biotin-[acetyl-CoA-carboxylase] ligase [Roseospira marina]